MGTNLKIVFFIAGALLLAYLTRSSLGSLRRHGLYRWLAWVAILGLVLLNINVWFRDPFSPNQIIAWLLLLFSLYLVIHGVLLLRQIGHPQETRSDEGLLAFEKTTQLVTSSLYRYIRHPLYSSLFFLTWGVFFKQPSLPGAGLAFLSSLFLTLTARVEEAENLRYFGSAYRAYMQRTKMFIPFLF